MTTRVITYTSKARLVSGLARVLAQHEVARRAWLELRLGLRLGLGLGLRAKG